MSQTPYKANVTPKGVRMDSDGSDEVFTAEQLEQIRNQEDKRQENLLEDISQGVGVLKQQALDIDKEVTSQNVALDKLEQNVDETRDEIEHQTEAAQSLRQQVKGMCWMYVVIVLLFVALIVVLAIPGKKKNQ